MITARVKSVFNLLKRVGFGVLVLTAVSGLCNCNAYACNTTWTNLGSPPSPSLISNAVYSNFVSTTIICGTTRDFRDPISGGIFLRHVDDTTWYPSGLVYHDINELRRVAFNPASIFAATSEGLYRSNDEAATWELVTTIGSSGFRDQCSFTISPFDSNQWFLSATEFGVGPLYISSNGGVDWETHWLGTLACELTHSLFYDHRLYYADGNLRMYNSESGEVDIITDSLDQFVTCIIAHPFRPWIYFCTSDSIGRLDEDTGDLRIVPILGDALSQDIVFCPPDLLLLGTNDNLYVMDENLENWQSSTDGASGGADPLLCTSFAQLSLFRGELHCRNAFSGISESFPNVQPEMIAAFPNPFNSILNISLDVPLHQEVTLSLYDLLGREVDVVYRGRLSSSTISYVAPAALSSGVYFLRASAGERSVLGKVVLLK